MDIIKELSLLYSGREHCASLLVDMCDSWRHVSDRHPREKAEVVILHFVCNGVDEKGRSIAEEEFDLAYHVGGKWQTKNEGRRVSPSYWITKSKAIKLIEDNRMETVNQLFAEMKLKAIGNKEALDKIETSENITKATMKVIDLIKAGDLEGVGEVAEELAKSFEKPKKEFQSGGYIKDNPNQSAMIEGGEQIINMKKQKVTPMPNTLELLEFTDSLWDDERARLDKEANKNRIAKFAELCGGFYKSNYNKINQLFAEKDLVNDLSNCDIKKLPSCFNPEHWESKEKEKETFDEIILKAENDLMKSLGVDKRESK